MTDDTPMRRAMVVSATVPTETGRGSEGNRSPVRRLRQREAWDRLLASLDQTLRLSEARYKAGLDGYLGVLVAQRTLFLAEDGRGPAPGREGQ
jgi:hypothetical protein